MEPSSHSQSLLCPCCCEPGGLYPARQHQDWYHHEFSKPVDQQGIIINVLLTARDPVIAPSPGSLIPFLSLYSPFSAQPPDRSFKNTHSTNVKWGSCCGNGMAGPQKI